MIGDKFMSSINLKATLFALVAAGLAKADLPFALGMIILDVLAPIFLMFGLQTANSENASLLNNFEIVVTTVIALVVFKEIVSKRLWLAIILITLSSILLTVDDFSSLQFSYGSIFVVLACICWGFENNCTRMLASKNTYEIVILKVFFLWFRFVYHSFDYWNYYGGSRYIYRKSNSRRYT